MTLKSEGAPDGDTCTAGCEPRVQRCNRQERESDQVYKELQRTSEVRAFRTLLYALRILEHAERALARFLEFSFSLLVFGDSVTDLSVGTRSAAVAPFCVSIFFRFLRRIEVRRTGASMARSRSRRRNH